MCNETARNTMFRRILVAVATIAQRPAYATAPESGNGQMGMGLRTMHYRARLIGGTFEISLLVCLAIP